MLNRRSLLKMIGAGTSLTLIPTAQLLAKKPGKHYVMVYDVRRCTGCTSCTVNCNIENNIDPGRPRTKVNQLAFESKNGVATLAMPNQCNHCDNPPCVKVCPTGATYKREEDGIVVIDYDKCIKCMMCVPACPYGARAAGPVGKNPPEKCNFCIDRLQNGLLPACVESCIGGARVFGDLNDPKSEVSRLVRENKVYGLLNNLNTKPNILYIGLPEEMDDKAMLSIKPTDWQR